MMKTLFTTATIFALAACQSSALSSHHWQLTKGQLSHNNQTINWQDSLLSSCSQCNIESINSKDADSQTVSHKITEAGQFRAIKVRQFTNTITIPQLPRPITFSVSHNRDGSVRLYSQSGQTFHLNLHQLNLLQIGEQKFSLWLDGYNPASRNWQYDDAHDAPLLSYTVLAH